MYNKPTPLTPQQIEDGILSLLAAGPMLQKEIMAAMPGYQYVLVGNTIRALARRGLIRREKRGATYLVALVPIAE